MLTLRTFNRERFIHLRDVIFVLVRRDFRARYKHTSVGMLWSVLNPLLFLLIFYLVFAHGLDLLDTPRLSGIFIAILSWQWVQGGLNQAAASITGNSNLIGQPGFPVEALPVVSTITSMVNFLIALPLLAIFMMFEGFTLGVTALWLPVILAIQFVMILSASYFVAAMNVSFRDVEQSLPIILQLGYFITPIFYELGNLSNSIKALVLLNPVTHLVEGYRSLLLRQEAPVESGLIVILVCSLLLLVVTVAYFRSARSRFLEEL